MNGRIKAVLNGAKKAAASRKGKVIISSCGAVLLAAVIIAAAVNINGSHDIVLKYGALDGNNVPMKAYTGSSSEYTDSQTQALSVSSSSSVSVKANSASSSVSLASAANSQGQVKAESNVKPGENSTTSASKDKTTGGKITSPIKTYKSTQKTSGKSSGGTDANSYKRVDKVMTYTDEITGIKQTVHFQGVGFSNEVAGGYAEINTTAEMGAKHHGDAVAILTGTNGKSIKDNSAGIGRDGICESITFSNLTAGKYTVKLTAQDGTVVAQYHFTVDSKGNV